MRISEILKGKRSFSFEVFPPNTQVGSLDDIYNTIDALQTYNPDFISVTFKSSGDFSKDTIDLASYIRNHTSAEPLVHLTCGALKEDDVDRLIEVLKKENLENVLALRGDRPQNFEREFLQHFHYASDLMKYLKERHNFCMGAACYAEGHIECTSLYEDLVNLKIKQDCGAEFFISQLFYDNNYYYRLVRAAKKMGITIPIIPGIMPLTSTKMFHKIQHMAGASIPFELRVLFDRFKDNKQAMHEIGIAYAVNQIIELLANDADGIHIYTMNNASVAQEIYERISSVVETELR